MEMTPEEKADFEKMIADSVSKALAAEPKPEPDDEEPEPTPAQRQPAKPDPMGDLIAPYFQRANLQAAAADDKAEFYSSYSIVKDGDEEEDEQSVSRSMRKDIEKTFTQLMKEGRPQTREAIYHYLLGKSVATDKKKFMERSSTKKKQEMDQAKAGADISGSSAAQSLSVSQMWNMPMDKMSEALTDSTF